MSMEQRDNSAPTFCRNGCGFYAAQAFDGMCSKCFKDLKSLQQNESPVTAIESPTATPSGSMSVLAAAAATGGEDVDAVAAALSKTSLSEMNQNASSNLGSDKAMDSPSNSGRPSPESSQLDAADPTTTASPTVATAKSSVENKEGSTLEGTSSTCDNNETPSEDDKGKKPKKNRCMECRKKVGLTGFVCHCGKLFCSLHRYSDTHDCTFDFKEKGQEEIRKNNPVVKAEKVQKI